MRLGTVILCLRARGPSSKGSLVRGSGQREHHFFAQSEEVGISTTEDHSGAAPASGGSVDMKLEEVVIPVSDVDCAKEFYGDWGGGSTATAPAMNSASSSSRRQALIARSSSAPTSPRPHPALLRPCCSLFPTLRLRTTSWSGAVSRRPRSSTAQRGQLVGFETASTPSGVSAGSHPIAPATSPSPHSATGRQRLDFPGGHRPPAGAHRPWRHVVPFRQRTGGCDGTGSDRPPRARAAHRSCRRGVAGLVRGIHGGRASWHGIAQVSTARSSRLVAT